ncbi:MAG: hypothetical protein KIT60_16095 [Burkholderiaceae bacterium]|nr:hypothetical protein [Burkholderiaceae bacterium]
MFIGSAQPDGSPDDPCFLDLAGPLTIALAQGAIAMDMDLNHALAPARLPHVVKPFGALRTSDVARPQRPLRRLLQRNSRTTAAAFNGAVFSTTPKKE